MKISKTWRDSEVIAFLEEKIHMDLITEREMDFYLDYTYNQYFDKEKFFYTYKSLLRQMKKLYNK